MARVPQINFSNAGVLAGIQAIMQGAQTVASLKSRSGSAIAGGITGGINSIVGSIEAGKQRDLRREEMASVEADRAAGRRLQLARMEMDSIKNDMSIATEELESRQNLLGDLMSMPATPETAARIQEVQAEAQRWSQQRQSGASRVKSLVDALQAPQIQPECVGST